MAVHYTRVEADYLRTQRMEREPGIDLIRCSDSLWRTKDEKKAYDDSFRSRGRLGACIIDNESETKHE